MSAVDLVTPYAPDPVTRQKHLVGDPARLFGMPPRLAHGIDVETDPAMLEAHPQCVSCASRSSLCRGTI